MKKALVNFEIKSNSPARALTVEGFANKAVVDRGGDIIPPNAWTLEEFKSNNILLYNHNQDVPIGTADVHITDDGLVAKAKISKSNEAPIPFIRDMIKEGILKSFSVGFDSKGSEEKQTDGTTMIKQANLLELSVVSVPMNQDSTFEISSMDKCISTWKTKSYHEARSDVLRLKGAFVAACVHDQIAKLQESETGFERESVFERICEQANISEKELDDILAGNTTQISDSVLLAFAKNIDIDEEQLRQINPGATESEKADGSEKEGDKEEADADEEESSDEDESKEDKAIDEMPKEDEEEEEEEEKSDKSFQECVSEKIPVLMEEGRPRDQAIAIAISQCSEKFGKSCPVEIEDYLRFMKLADSISETKQEVTHNLDQSNETIENANTSNPAMDQFKAQTTILASIDGGLKALLDEIRLLRSDLQTEKQEQEKPDMTEEEEDDSESRALDEHKHLLLEYEKKLQKLEQTLL
jgi:HK97 family phage prohead protease